jgi:hypothetical protein
MRIGIDLDNTLADYAAPLARLCREYGVANGGTEPKLALRDHLRRAGREPEWTRLQGEIYGPLMAEARLYPGAADFLAQASAAGTSCVVVSHRTRHPIAGQGYDLHESARRWLADCGLGSIEIHLEETKALKLARISSLSLDVFIDDLPELLGDPAFPAGVEPVLFDPASHHHNSWEGRGAASWSAVSDLLRL